MRSISVQVQSLKFLRFADRFYAVTNLWFITYEPGKCGYDILLSFNITFPDGMGIVPKLITTLRGSSNTVRFYGGDFQTEDSARMFCEFLICRCASDAGPIIEFNEILQDFHHGTGDGSLINSVEKGR